MAWFSESETGNCSAKSGFSHGWSSLNLRINQAWLGQKKRCGKQEANRERPVSDAVGFISQARYLSSFILAARHLATFFSFWNKDIKLFNDFWSLYSFLIAAVPIKLHAYIETAAKCQMSLTMTLLLKKHGKLMNRKTKKNWPHGKGQCSVFNVTRKFQCNRVRFIIMFWFLTMLSVTNPL